RSFRRKTGRHLAVLASRSDFLFRAAQVPDTQTDVRFGCRRNPALDSGQSVYLFIDELVDGFEVHFQRFRLFLFHLYLRSGISGMSVRPVGTFFDYEVSRSRAASVTNASRCVKKTSR